MHRLLIVLVVALSWSRPVWAGPALLFDVNSGMVLYSNDADQPWYPASLTKLMTAYVVFEALRDGELAKDAKLINSANARKQSPSKLGLPLNANISVSLALQALIVKSANDVAVMFAEKVSGTEAAFVARMNATAKKLGMTRSRFANPNGLPGPNQQTTARDLGILARALITNFPKHAHLFKLTKMRLGKVRMRSHNGLLRTYPGADGMKTGFICDSGFNIVASATRDGRRLIAIVLGGLSARSRNERASKLLEHGFNNYLWKAIFAPPNIATMSFTPEQPVRVASIRRQVRAWVCGYRPKRTKKKKKTQRISKKKKKVAQGAVFSLGAVER